MTGKEFIEDRINTGSRFLVSLHEDTREQIASLLEQYAALHIRYVVGRSEQLPTPQNIQWKARQLTNTAFNEWWEKQVGNLR
jgi:hypothetical protein